MCEVNTYKWFVMLPNSCPWPCIPHAMALADTLNSISMRFNAINQIWSCKTFCQMRRLSSRILEFFASSLSQLKLFSFDFFEFLFPRNWLTNITFSIFLPWISSIELAKPHRKKKHSEFFRCEALITLFGNSIRWFDGVSFLPHNSTRCKSRIHFDKKKNKNNFPEHLSCFSFYFRFCFFSFSSGKNEIWRTFRKRWRFQLLMSKYRFAISTTSSRLR